MDREKKMATEIYYRGHKVERMDITDLGTVIVKTEGSDHTTEIGRLQTRDE